MHTWLPSETQTFSGAEGRLSVKSWNRVETHVNGGCRLETGRAPQPALCGQLYEWDHDLSAGTHGEWVAHKIYYLENSYHLQRINQGL